MPGSLFSLRSRPCSSVSLEQLSAVPLHICLLATVLFPSELPEDAKLTVLSLGKWSQEWSTVGLTGTLIGKGLPVPELNPSKCSMTSSGPPSPWLQREPGGGLRLPPCDRLGLVGLAAPTQAFTARHGAQSWRLWASTHTPDHPGWVLPLRAGATGAIEALLAPALGAGRIQDPIVSCGHSDLSTYSSDFSVAGEWFFWTEDVV